MKKITLTIFTTCLFFINGFSQCVVDEGSSSYDFEIRVNFYPAEVICTGTNSQFELGYNVSVTGSNIPSPVLYSNPNINLTCGSTVLYAGQIPITSGTSNGSITTTSNTFASSECQTTGTNTSETPSSPVYDCVGPTKINFQGGGPAGSFNINCSSQDITFPVKLLKFNGAFKNGINLLEWSTSEEKDFNYFQVERGKTARNFEAISEKIKHNGTGSFNWEDPKPLLNQRYSYYRLKSIDIDGSYAYSKIIAIEHFDENMPWQVSPNPSSDYLSLSWNNSFFQAEKVILTNLEGRLVHESQIKNQDSFQFDAFKLVKQTYIVSLENYFGRKLTKRIAVQ